MIPSTAWVSRLVFRRLSAVLVCLIPVAGLAVAQSPHVQICALDGRNDTPLAAAVVRMTAEGVDLSATTGADGCVAFVGAFPVSIEDSDALPTGLHVGAIYPNPAGAQAWLPVDADRSGVAEVQFFDLLGREAAPSRTVALAAGHQTIDLPVADLARGVYFTRVTTAAGTTVRSVVRGDGPVGRGPVVPLASPASYQSVAMDENAVRLEIERNGYVTAVEERVLRNNETVRKALLKITDQKIPLIDMKGLAYLGFEGGLYPGGTNTIPEAHFEAGLAAARSIEPLDLNGRRNAKGVYILTSIGMSNTSDEFCGVADPTNRCKLGTFMSDASLDPAVNTSTFVLVDGADPGKTAEKWVESDLNDYKRILEEELVPFGYSENQVQLAWIKLANAPPAGTLPDSDADAFRLQEQFGQIARAMKVRYPNLKMIFFSSRIYGGYAITDRNPEPFAYEQGFAVKWTVAAQIRQLETGEIDPISGDLGPDVAPWIGWGPYFWADGTNPRSDGLTWTREDLKEDGVHPAKPGIEKVAGILMDFFKTSPLTSCWFLAGQECQ